MKAIPLVLGAGPAAWLTFALLVVTAAAGFVIGLFAQLGPAYLVISTLAALVLLLWLGLALVRAPLPRKAMALFNRGSLYQPAMVAMVIVSLDSPVETCRAAMRAARCLQGLRGARQCSGVVVPKAIASAPDGESGPPRTLRDSVFPGVRTVSSKLDGQDSFLRVGEERAMLSNERD